MSKSAPSLKQIQHAVDSEIGKVVKEITVYSEDGHLARKSDDIIELYDTYKSALTNLVPEVDIEPKKLYIAFKTNKNIVDIVVLQNGLKIFINLKKGELDDPKNIMRDVSEVGHWGNGDYEVVVRSTENLEYIMSLVKQVL